MSTSLRGDIELSKIFQRLFSSTTSSLRVVKELGLDSARTDSNSSRISIWPEIVRRARIRGLLPQLISIALRDFPGQAAKIQQSLTRAELNFGSSIFDENRWRTSIPANQLERMIDRFSSLVPPSSFKCGLERSKSVARIVTARGAYGTGFLVAKNMLVTCHHLLPDALHAADAVAEFGFDEAEVVGRQEIDSARCVPSSGFVTSAEQDWTIVGVGKDLNSKWGAIPLTRASVSAGDRVFSIQHLYGGPKRISVFNSLVTYADNGVVQYLSDTGPGSSGSPIFNESWEVIGLHRVTGQLEKTGSDRNLFRNEAIAIQQLLGRVPLITRSSVGPTSAGVTKSSKGPRASQKRNPSAPSVIDWNDERNARRCQLIDKMMQDDLSAHEALELERLQDEMRKHLTRVAPLNWDAAKRLHAELIQKREAQK